MIKILNRRDWILLPLLSVVFVLAALIVRTQAAVLKDIRIGEYDGFTRIVFELDSPVKADQIVPKSSGQLAVVFVKTTAQLRRKIPVQRSPHIKDIQIWDASNQLSVVLLSDYEYVRHKSFSLMNPPRIVLDIQPGPIPAGNSAAKAPAEPKIEAAMSSKSAESKTPAASELNVSENEPAADRQNQAEADLEPNGKPSLPSANEDQPASPAIQAYEIKDDTKKNAEPPTVAQAAAGQTTDTQSGRLQFYLVVVLVLITIIILVLLLFMLLSKHHWTGDKNRLSAKEYLESQDRHIASLDARIQEQLKRYEEV